MILRLTYLASMRQPNGLRSRSMAAGRRVDSLSPLEKLEA
jgi:hypothetical protein